ncbi:MAG: methyltransferase domain-containing protein [Alphaproteobacteria bacterium]|nr:methyltransferase domain-containing protein [Alphaproteobacteria bacterium]
MSASPQSPAIDQREYWNGDVGARWAAHYERTDRMLERISSALFAAAVPLPGEHVLDIGCGAGTTSLALARAVGAEGRVTGLDISEPMLAVARTRAATAGLPITFTAADAASADMTGLGADLLFSRFGVMFFDDPISAFANLRQAASAKGRLAFVCWAPAAENAWVMEPMLAALPFLPPQPEVPPGTPGPFAFADKDRTRAIITHAGYREVEIEPLRSSAYIGDDAKAAAAEMLQIGPLSRAVAGLDEETKVSILTAVEGRLRAHEGKDGIALGAACWLVRAKA